MKLEIRSQKDFAAGCLFLAVGIVWALASLQYRVGTATAMGPGYFPLFVAIVVALLGLGSILRSFRVAEWNRIGPWPYATLFFITGGIVGFGLLLETTGLLPAGLLLLAMSCWSRWRTRPLETALLIAGLLALVVGLFVYGLGLTVDLY